MLGLLSDYMPEDPEKRQALSMGLLTAGAQMLANADRGFSPALGMGLLGGAQGYQNAREDQFQNAYRQAQKVELDSRAQARKQQQDAYGRIAAGYQADPNFKPSMADLLTLDSGAAIKGLLAPNGGVDHGLEPKIGINPTTGKPGYFIQDKAGGTKWLDAGVPDSFKLVPGTDYQAPGAFDTRTGTIRPAGSVGLPSVAPSGGGGVGAPAAAAPVAQVAQEADPLAPWAKLASPKQQDEMRGRVFEQDRKRLDELAAQVQQGRSIMRDLDRFGELNRQQATGGLIDKFGFIPTSDPEKREMEAIVARLAPNMRPAGSGTTSDRDLALYLQGLPGIDKTGDVNKSIRDQYAKQLQAAEQQFNFQQSYLTDRGHLNGVSDAYATAVENGKTGGLDLSKLSREQIAALQQADPEAFNRGVERFQRNGGGQPQGGGQGFAQLPAPNKFKGKTIKDQETGKRYRSDGLRWVEA